MLLHILHKLYHILQTGYGWAAAAFLFLADYCAGHRFIILLALAVSLHRGKFTLSELLRLTDQTRQWLKEDYLNT